MYVFVSKKSAKRVGQTVYATDVFIKVLFNYYSILYPDLYLINRQGLQILASNRCCMILSNLDLDVIEIKA